MDNQQQAPDNQTPLDLINAIKAQALNMSGLTTAFQSFSTALLNALAYVSAVFIGDTGTGGTKGLVPAPAAGDGAANKFLKASGGWSVINNPSATALGGVKSLAAVTHQFLTQIGTDGSVSQAQPTSADITGTTTNNNAAAGYIGEVISSNIAVGSAVSITSGTPANITSISLTAGDWDVSGWVSDNPAGTTTTQTFGCGISTTSATLGTGQTKLNNLSVGAGLSVQMPCATQRLSLASTTTVYLVVLASFSVSTMSAYGYITARRAR